MKKIIITTLVVTMLASTSIGVFAVNNESFTKEAPTMETERQYRYQSNDNEDRSREFKNQEKMSSQNFFDLAVENEIISDETLNQIKGNCDFDGEKHPEYKGIPFKEKESKFEEFKPFTDLQEEGILTEEEVENLLNFKNELRNENRSKNMEQSKGQGNRGQRQGKRMNNETCINE